MSIYFNGTSSYVNLSEPSILDFSPQSDFTIMGWVWFANFGTIIGKRYSSASIQYQLYGDNDSGDTFAAARLGGATILGSVAIQTSWHHVCLVNYESSPSNWSGYVLVDGGNTDETSPVAAGTQSGDAHVLIGARRGTNNTNTGYMLEGTVEDIRFYNRALSKPEVETIYVLRGRDRIYYGLVGRYFCMDGYPSQIATGTGRIRDEGLYKNNGTPINSPTYDASSVI